MSMDKEIAAAVDYILMAAKNPEIPEPALREIIENRLRLTCSEVLHWQAGCMHSAANKFTVKS